MIIWRGAGIFVFFIILGSAFLVMFAGAAVFGEPWFAEENQGWVLATGFVLSAVLTYGFHVFLERDKGKKAVDPATGQEIILKTPHELAFIPVKFWPYILLAVAVCFAVAAIFGVPIFN